MINEQNLWRVFEMKIDGTGLHELPLFPDADADNFDACYLADGRIVFCSTTCFSGVPCVGGAAAIFNLYRLELNGDIRQLTYEQDQDWCPSVLNNRCLLYLRREYTDLPHAFSRILFHTNPKRLLLNTRSLTQIDTPVNNSRNFIILFLTKICNKHIIKRRSKIKRKE